MLSVKVSFLKSVRHLGALFAIMAEDVRKYVPLFLRA